MRAPALATATLLALAAAGCGSSSPTTSAPSASTAPTSSTAAAAAPATPAAGCQKVSAPGPKGPGHLPAPTIRLDPNQRYTARMLTSCGEVDIALDVRHAPRTTASFVYLVRHGFYDGLTFHRIVTGYVIQGGDPEGNGQGGPGYTVTEAPPPGLRYTRGVVAMAKTATDPRGASGSQFYIVTAPATALPADYALLGRVVGPNAAVNAIDSVPNDPTTNSPLEPVVIDRVTISQSP